MYDKYVEEEVLQKLFLVLLRLFRTLYIIEKHRERVETFNRCTLIKRVAEIIRFQGRDTDSSLKARRRA